jgi:hypothetical protein
MKPKTKKTIIIVAAVAAIAVIVWLVFFRKKSTSAIIAGLNCSKDLKDGLRSMVDLINTTWDDAHKQAISEKAAQNGRTLAQQTVITALYSLYDAEKIDEATYNSVLAQLI